MDRVLEGVLRRGSVLSLRTPTVLAAQGARWSCAMGSAVRRGLLSALLLAFAARAAGSDGGPGTTRLRELKDPHVAQAGPRVAGGSAGEKIAERKTFWEKYREGVRLEAFAGLDSVDDDSIEEDSGDMEVQGDDIERCSTAAEMLEKKGADYTCAFVTERCSGRGLGPLNYLQLTYHPTSDSPRAAGRQLAASFLFTHHQLYPMH